MSIVTWIRTQLSSFRGCMHFLTIIHICLLALICKLALQQKIHKQLPTVIHEDTSHQNIIQALQLSIDAAYEDIDVAMRLINTINNNLSIFNKVNLNTTVQLTLQDRRILNQQAGPMQLISDSQTSSQLGNLRVLSIMNTLSLVQSIQVNEQIRVIYPAGVSFHPQTTQDIQIYSQYIILRRKSNNTIVSARILTSNLRQYLSQFGPVYVRIDNMYIQYTDTYSVQYRHTLYGIPISIGIYPSTQAVSRYTTLVKILDFMFIIAILISAKIINTWCDKHIGSIVKLNNVLTDTLEYSFNTASNYKIQPILNRNQTIQHICNRFMPIMKNLKPPQQTTIRHPSPQPFNFTQQLHTIINQLNDKMSQHTMAILSSINSKTIIQQVNEHFTIRQKEYKYLFRQNTNKRQLPIFFKYAYNSLFLSNEQFRIFTQQNRHEAQQAVSDYFQDTNVILRCHDHQYLSQQPQSLYHHVLKTVNGSIKESILLRCQGLLLSKIYFMVKDSDGGMRHCRELGMVYQMEDIEVEIENSRHQIAEMTKLKNSM